MSGISVEVLPDAGAPQVGVTVSGLPSGSPSVVTVQRSTDGVTWETVRGAQREAVTGSAFFRDFVPPLNVPCTYRLVTDAAITPAAVYAWSGTANASASTETRDGVVTRTNRLPAPNNAGAFWPTTSAGATATGSNETTGGPTALGGPATWRKMLLTSAPTTAAPGVNSPTGIANMAAVTPGETVTGSVFGILTRAGVPIRAAFFWYDASGVAITPASTNGDPSPSSGGWERRSVTAVVPASAAYARVGYFALQTVGTIVAGDYMGATGGLIEGGSALGAYFDGNTAPVAAPTTATITVESDTAWLQDPLNPRSAVAVSCVRGTDGVMLLSPSAGEIARRMPADVVQVQGARLPVASLGVRQAPAGVMLHLRALVAEQGALVKALADLIDTAGTVVLRGLPQAVPLDPVAHVIAPEVTDSPIVGGLLGPRRDWVMSVTQVRAPSPTISVPWWTYDQVKALWAGFSYDAVLAARPGATYLDWLRDPTPAASTLTARTSEVS